jgi:hypothetical protein
MEEGGMGKMFWLPSVDRVVIKIKEDNLASAVKIKFLGSGILVGNCRMVAFFRLSWKKDNIEQNYKNLLDIMICWAFTRERAENTFDELSSGVSIDGILA